MTKRNQPYKEMCIRDSPSADTRHGFRINTGKYSYWMVCSFLSTDCRLWVNAFSFLSLDRYMRAVSYTHLHQIGQELADRLLGGRFQVVISTHLNTGHIHNHLVWNSVSIQTGKKYRSNEKSYVTGVRPVSYTHLPSAPAPSAPTIAWRMRCALCSG